MYVKELCGRLSEETGNNPEKLFVQFVVYFRLVHPDSAVRYSQPVAN